MDAPTPLLPLPWPHSCRVPMSPTLHGPGLSGAKADGEISAGNFLLLLHISFCSCAGKQSVIPAWSYLGWEVQDVTPGSQQCQAHMDLHSVLTVLGTTGATTKQNLEEIESSYFYEFL